MILAIAVIHRNVADHAHDTVAVAVERDHARPVTRMIIPMITLMIDVVTVHEPDRNEVIVVTAVDGQVHTRENQHIRDRVMI